mgnify:CR=1 FL=1|jgi:prevent-host-death family protein
MTSPASDLVSSLPSVSATEVKNAFASVWDRIMNEGAIAVTRHEKPKAVLLSIERFEELVQAGQPALDQLSAEFDSLLSKMQSPNSRKAMAAAFKADPASLGKSAVAAAKSPKRR